MSLLHMDAVTMRFGGLTALADFTLRLHPSELVGIIGPNGAGKTTVFNILTGIYAPTSGRVILAGEDITGLRPDRIAARGVSRTFQNVRLFPSLTALQNVLVGGHVRLASSPWAALVGTPGYRARMVRNVRRARELLEIVGLGEFADYPATALPYGLQRRLEIARALATEPRLLLLDEPAAGMSPQEIDDLMEFISGIRQRFHLTILVIEHHMQLVMGLCERILVLNHGITIAEGSPAEIQQNRAVIQAYLGETDGA